MEPGKSKIKALADLVASENPLSGSYSHLLSVFSHGGRILSRFSFIKTLISSMRTAPSRPNHLPMTPPPNTITLQISFQHMSFGGTQSLILFTEKIDAF